MNKTQSLQSTAKQQSDNSQTTLFIDLYNKLGPKQMVKIIQTHKVSKKARPVKKDLLKNLRTLAFKYPNTFLN